MKKKLLLLSGTLVVAGFLALGAYLVGGNRIFAALNQRHLLATLCDVPGMGCGGRLVSQPLPCFNFPGVVWAKVLVAGGIDAGGTIISYAFLPTTFLHFLPTHIGQSFLGLTAGTGFCATDPTNFHRGFTLPYGFFYGTSI